MRNAVQNKHVVITGGASGIGAETARLLSSREAKVFLGDRSEQACQGVVEKILAAGGHAAFAPLDVTELDSVKAFHKRAIEIFGDIHAAINNAGIDIAPAIMSNVPDEDYHRIIAVNLTGVWYCMKQQLMHMLRGGGGHIINVASVAGTIGAPMTSAYCASKHGVIGLTKTAALEYAKSNIRVNAICPGLIQTPMLEGTFAKLPPTELQTITNRNPMGRLGEPGEIAGAIAWLCSDESSFMTGQSMVIDGGLLARQQR